MYRKSKLVGEDLFADLSAIVELQYPPMYLWVTVEKAQNLVDSLLGCILFAVLPEDLLVDIAYR
jgi:hypothetical protein